MSSSLWLHGLQHIRLPCPPPSPGVCSNSCPLSWWCHPPISPSVFPCAFCLQSSPASGFFPKSLGIRWPKHWNFSFSISPSKEYSELISFQDDWFNPLAFQGSLKSLLQHHSLKASILWYSAFFMVQLSQPYMATGKTTALTMQTFVGKVMSLLFNTLSTFCFSFPAKKQLSSNFMAAITICSNFRAQEEKICHCFHLRPPPAQLYSLWKILVDNSGPDNLYKISVSWVFSPF